MTSSTTSPFRSLQLPSYCLTEIVYQGTRTVVYRAMVRATQQPVVLKVLAQESPSFHELVQFRNQYTVAKNLPIAGIVRPLELEPCGNGYALLMEDFGGVDLGQYVQQSPLSLADILSIAVQLADILHELHQHRVIHKDIKPANILIHPDTKQIKLIDFSIASLLPKETQTIQSPGTLEGTLAYLAPEQTGRMNRGIDYRTDFYALGITLYELLTGQLPFISDDPMELIHCHIAQMPVTADQVNSEVPATVAAIVAKLMAKNAEDRYQSALGLKHDLECCLRQWQEQGQISDAALGWRDVSDRFLIPEKLYGRDTEVQTLLHVFEQVAQGQTEMMLVAGFSGIGKTAVINEVHKPITRQNGYFIKGKFDQFNRSTPFSAFIQAFRSLMGQLLGESDADLARWRTKILEAVEENGQVIIDVIPELATIIGAQPPLPELSGVAAQNRFNRLFRQFVRVFTTKNHPLVIFLDDLQWADSASLGLLKLLMGESDAGYLLMLGAYRDNEVSPAHPLMLTLEEMSQKDANIETLTLAPLDPEDITSLVADTLLCTQTSASAVAQLVFQKTQGNPFFTTQFLQGLYEDGCITYSMEAGCWQCDIARVRSLALTNDVVAFMMGRLKKLPDATQNVLRLAACIGNRFDLAMLAVVCEQPQADVAIALWPALKEGLVIPESETYKFFQNHDDRVTPTEQLTVGYQFLHDRVQQAAYALIPEAEKVATQYRIGQLLLACMNEAEDDALLFNVVGYLNFSRDCLVDNEEQLQLVRLNLAAAQKALNSTAYDATIDYCHMGIKLLGDDGWHWQYDLALALYQVLGSAQLSNANYAELEQTTNKAFAEITSATDRAAICVLQLVSCCLQGRYAEAIDWGLTGLRDLDIDIQEDKIPALVEQEFTRLAEMMHDRDIDDLLEHNNQVPAPRIQAAIKLLVAIDPPVYITGRNGLYALVGLLGTRYSIEHGNIAESAKSYANYGMLLGSVQGDYQRGYTFANMGVELAHRFKSKAMQCQAGLMLGSFAHPWARPIAGASKVNNESFLAGMEAGETQYAAYNLFGSVLNLLFQGEDLTSLANNILPSYDAVEKRVNSEMLRIALAGAQIFVQQLVTVNAADPDTTDLMTTARAVICAGEVSRNQLGLAIHYSLEMHRCCIIGDFEEGWRFFQQLQPIVSSLVGFPTHSYYFYYGSLVLLNTQFATTSNLDQKCWEWVEANQTQLKVWADSCPENFLHKYLLVQAECCRVRGDHLGALDAYHRAIHEAHTHGFMQEEALIHECVARLYRQQDKDSFATPHMQEAFYGYARWGAGAKAEQIKPPSLLTKRPPSESTLGTGDSAVSDLMMASSTGVHSRANSGANQSINATLDQQAIFKASQAIASNIDLDVLLTEVTRIILQNSGGDRCAIILPDDSGDWQVRAMATSATTQLCTEPLNGHPQLPIKLLHYVKHTQEAVVIDDLVTDLPIIDDYLNEYQPKSVLCLPLLNQGQLIGLLYLNNDLTSGAFTHERMLILNFLCTQAAISLENARLYQQAQHYSEQLEQSQLQIVQSEKMATLGNLVAGVAHEINNPIGFLNGSVKNATDYVQELFEYLDTYQSQQPPNEVVTDTAAEIELDFLLEDLPKLLNAMETATDRIQGISNSLRTFSRADTESKASANLHEGLNSTLLILKYRLKANENRPAIELTQNYGNLPEINCFPGQLNQVFMNILANAIDMFDEIAQQTTFEDLQQNPQEMTIQTRELAEQNAVEIRISDNGKGMLDEVKSRIFDHLFTTKGVGKGTGLGLAIARQIVEETHGGTLKVQSEVGQGTEFSICLPL